MQDNINDWLNKGKSTPDGQCRQTKRRRVRLSASSDPGQSVRAGKSTTKEVIVVDDSDSDSVEHIQDPPEVISISSSPETQDTLKPVLAHLNDKKVVSLQTLGGHSKPNPLDKPSKARNIARPPVILSNPAQVSQHVPCSLVPSPLEPAFATSLYLSLLDEAKHFTRHTWFINGRKVQSPHTSGYYRLSQEDGGTKRGGEYWYAGKKEPEPPNFPPLLREAINKINPFINSILSGDCGPDRASEDSWRRNVWSHGSPKRYPLEYDGPWQANVAAVNCYEGGESAVGWHADQLTHLGPYTTIVSLSLGTQRNFRLRPIPHPSDPTKDVWGRSLRTYEVGLPHNSILIMHATCQELYKHSVAPVGKGKSLDVFRPAYSRNGQYIENVQQREKRNERINVTFRFYRPDFHPLPDTLTGRQGVPHCRCGMPT